ncbi:hypothetical protein LIER_00294 [Lithospermum erythrorhizon]|uniref:phosphatidylglycerophosphatase n=1 Tax=Lithospermum erythrorhizon TaxID=34254 RepID=A0AAV3NGV1_LITER
MYIEELKEGGELGVEEMGLEGDERIVKRLSGDEVVEGKEVYSGDNVLGNSDEGGGVFVWGAKRVLVGAGARMLFYPTLLYNVVRNKVQAEFRWWDWIDEYVLLGAIPFRSDVIRLKELGVGGVVTLNEPYETLVPTSLYYDYGIRHLVLPTRDYLYAPSLSDISRAVYFIHENAMCGRSTYVHCKAGRGRSTTIVICYLVKYKHMTPDAAYGYVKSIRPRVLLASAQWQAVVEFYHFCISSTCGFSAPSHPVRVIPRSPIPLGAQDLVPFDEGSVVVITQSDLDGYDESDEYSSRRDEIWTKLSLVYRVRVAGGSAFARLSCLWLRCQAQEQTASCQKLSSERGCLIGANQHGGITVDIHVYS